MSKASEELQGLFGPNQDWEVVKRSNFEILTECTELIDGRKFQDIVNIIFEYTQEDKVLDIQLLCLYLQAHFNLNHSADDFVSILEVLSGVLAKYDLISPVNKKDMVVMRSTIALANEAVDAINYYYPEFLNDQFELVKNYLDKIQESLISNIETVDLAEFNRSKNQLLITISKYIVKEDDDTAEAITQVEEQKISSTKSDREDRYSFHWANLLLKISKFSSLANSSAEADNKFELALLFDSIQTEMHNFNPIKYFPKEFQVFFNAVNSEVYTDIQQIIEGSKGSPLWDFMLQKTETKIKVDPESKQTEIGDFNIDDLLKISNKPSNAINSLKNTESNHKTEARTEEVYNRTNEQNQKADFDSAFDILDDL